jgi:hypothetical protein
LVDEGKLCVADGIRLAYIKCERSKAMRAKTNVKAGTEANSEKIAR